MNNRQVLAFLVVAGVSTSVSNAQSPAKEKHAGIQPSMTAGVQVPPGFAAPIYPGSVAKFIYGPADATKTDEEVTVILQTDDRIGKIVRFYKTELPKQGWTVESGQPKAMTLYANKAKQTLKIEIADHIGDRVINVTVGPKK